MTSAAEDFVELRERKRRITELAEDQLEALERFHAGGPLTGDGPLTIEHFALNQAKLADNHASITSSTTCMRSLLSSPDLQGELDFSPFVKELIERDAAGDLSTGDELDHRNPYTLGQLLPTLKRMCDEAELEPPPFVDGCLTSLKSAVDAPGVGIDDFPANGYLTYWSLVALDAWDVEVTEIGKRSLEWCRKEIDHQLALILAEDDEADPYQLGYALLAVRRFASGEGELRESIVKAALKELFAAQLPKGVWEKKDRLFTYGAHGDAYPFAFELLNAVLREFADAPQFLAPYQENLERAVAWIRRNAYGKRPPYLWRSGHLADSEEPESWATAEVYYFLQNLRTFLAERIFAGQLRKGGRGHAKQSPDAKAFEALWQPDVPVGGEGRVLLGDLLVKGMLEDLRRRNGEPGAYSLAQQPNRQDLTRSGILFGPPGTGKTTYARAIAKYLGWPMITITPADFAAQGMLLIPTVGRQIFDRLIELEDVVIFFDEMEELFRTRAGEKNESFEQRFLTTSFLPSIQDLSDAANCIYLLATNHLKDLDPAAQSPRRFDFQLFVRPPAVKEKLKVFNKDFHFDKDSAQAQALAKQPERLSWASRSETKALFQKIKDKPDEAERLVQELDPALWGERPTYEADEKENVIDALTKNR